MAILRISIPDPNEDTGQREHFFTCFRKPEQYRQMFRLKFPEPLHPKSTDYIFWLNEYVTWMRKQIGVKEVKPIDI